MALADLVGTFLGEVLGVGEEDGAVVDGAGNWWLAGSGMGRVRVLEYSPTDVWIEVAHVVALGVENWTVRLWEEANEATVRTPAHTALMGDTLVVRMVVSAFDATAESIDRAIGITWNVSSILCDKVVAGLGIGTCPDAEVDGLVDGGAVPIPLDLGIDDGFTSAPREVDGALVASAGPSGAAGYL